MFINTLFYNFFYMFLLVKLLVQLEAKLNRLRQLTSSHGSFKKRNKHPWHLYLQFQVSNRAGNQLKTPTTIGIILTQFKLFDSFIGNSSIIRPDITVHSSAKWLKKNSSMTTMSTHTMAYIWGCTRRNAHQQHISIYRANHRSPSHDRTNEHPQLPPTSDVFG